MAKKKVPTTIDMGQTNIALLVAGLRIRAGEQLEVTVIQGISEDQFLITFPKRAPKIVAEERTFKCPVGREIELKHEIFNPDGESEDLTTTVLLDNYGAQEGIDYEIAYQSSWATRIIPKKPGKFEIYFKVSNEFGEDDVRFEVKTYLPPKIGPIEPIVVKELGTMLIKFEIEPQSGDEIEWSIESSPNLTVHRAGSARFSLAAGEVSVDPTTETVYLTVTGKGGTTTVEVPVTVKPLELPRICIESSHSAVPVGSDAETKFSIEWTDDAPQKECHIDAEWDMRGPLGLLTLQGNTLNVKTERTGEATIWLTVHCPNGKKAMEVIRLTVNGQVMPEVEVPEVSEVPTVESTPEGWAAMEATALVLGAEGPEQASEGSSPADVQVPAEPES